MKIKTAKDVKKIVKKQLTAMHLTAPEEKCLIYELPNTAIPSAGNILFVGGVAQGVDQNQRVGNEINVTRIELVFHTNQSSLAFSDIGNIIMLYDKETDGTLPAVLFDDQFGSFDYAPYWSFSQTSNGNEIVKSENNFPSRYRELCRIPYHTQSSITGTSVVSKVHRKTMTFKRPLKVQFTGTSVNVSDCSHGGIYLAYAGQQSTNTSTLNAIVKIVYTDM